MLNRSTGDFNSLQTETSRVWTVPQIQDFCFHFSKGKPGQNLGDEPEPEFLPMPHKDQKGAGWACEQHTDHPSSFCSGPPWHKGTALLSQGQHLVVKFISHRALSLFSRLLRNDRQNQNPIQLKASKKGRWTPSKQTKTVWNFDLKSTAVFYQQGLNSLTLPYLCYH